MTLFINLSLCAPEGFIHTGWLLIQNGSIAQVGFGAAPFIPDAHIIDATGLTAIPGFIDVHVHGAAGVNVMQAEYDDLTAMSTFFARHGVTSFLATTITAPKQTIDQVIQQINIGMQQPLSGAQLLGLHLEGPYINPVAKGVHDTQHIRRAQLDEYLPWFESGIVKQVTVAPEYPEHIALIKACRERSVIASIGHSAATYEQVLQAVHAGATQATHTCNGMVGFHHRKPGILGAVLTEDAISCELIADGVHVHPAIIKLIVRAKGPERIVLITDAEFGAGCNPGMYKQGDQVMEVTHEAVYRADGTLAGSVLTMDRALRNMIQTTGLTLQQAWPMASANAARQLGIDHKKGSLRAGYDADIVLLDAHLHVQMTIVGGKIILNGYKTV